jgi:hypothetical protein
MWGRLFCGCNAGRTDHGNFDEYHMTSTVRGIYRTPGYAFVTDDTTAFDIPEPEYRECEYVPDYDTLPTKDAYKATPRILRIKG